MPTQKEIFFQYLLNQQNFLENDVIQLRQNLRMRNIDAVDCLELALAMERLNSFKDFLNSASSIFRLNLPADYNTSIIKIDYATYKKAALELRRRKGEKNSNDV